MGVSGQKDIFQSTSVILSAPHRISVIGRNDQYRGPIQIVSFSSQFLTDGICQFFDFLSIGDHSEFPRLTVHGAGRAKSRLYNIIQHIPLHRAV